MHKKMSSSSSASTSSLFRGFETDENSEEDVRDVEVKKQVPGGLVERYVRLRRRTGALLKENARLKAASTRADAAEREAAVWSRRYARDLAASASALSSAEAHVRRVAPAVASAEGVLLRASKWRPGHHRVTRSEISAFARAARDLRGILEGVSGTETLRATERTLCRLGEERKMLREDVKKWKEAASGSSEKAGRLNNLLSMEKREHARTRAALLDAKDNVTSLRTAVDRQRDDLRDALDMMSSGIEKRSVIDDDDDFVVPSRYMSDEIGEENVTVRGEIDTLDREIEALQEKLNNVIGDNEHEEERM